VRFPNGSTVQAVTSVLTGETTHLDLDLRTSRSLVASIDDQRPVAQQTRLHARA